MGRCERVWGNLMKLDGNRDDNREYCGNEKESHGA